MVFLSSFSLVPYPWFQALACLGLRKPHSRLSQALAVVLTSKVQAESEGNSGGAETQDSKHWHQYVRGVRAGHGTRLCKQCRAEVDSGGKRSHQMKRLGREESEDCRMTCREVRASLKKGEKTDQLRCIQTNER